MFREKLQKVDGKKVGRLVAGKETSPSPLVVVPLELLHARWDEPPEGPGGGLQDDLSPLLALAGSSFQPGRGQS